MKDQIDTVVIGGSNTVIERGYLAAFVNRCAQLGVTINVVSDNSVGNTTIGYGLMRLKQEERLADADLLVIEYNINDAFLYSIGHEERVEWARLFEGTIRYARKLNPTIHILIVILDTATGEWLHGIPMLAAQTHYLAAAYDCWVCDVQREAIRRLGYMTVTSGDFYAPGDAAHYAVPLATAVIGNMLADYAAPKLEEATGSRYFLPHFIDPLQRAGSRILGVTDILAVGDLPEQRFENWRFKASTVDIASSTVSFRIDTGRLLGVAYVCTKDTSNLFISSGVEILEVGTMKHTVLNGDYAFLVSYVPLEVALSKLAQRAGPSIDISLSIGGNPNRFYSPRDGVQISPDGERVGGASFTMIGVHYVGELSDLAVESGSTTRRDAAEAS